MMEATVGVSLDITVCWGRVVEAVVAAVGLRLRASKNVKAGRIYEGRCPSRRGQLGPSAGPRFRLILSCGA